MTSSPESPRARGVVAAAMAAVVAAGIGFALVAAADGPVPGDVATLSSAAAAGDLELARSLLASGHAPDEPRFQGLTPLMRAVLRDDADMVQLLLDFGADPAATELAGLSAAHLAAEADAVAALGTLIAAGADIQVRSANGMNVLDHAASAGSVEVLPVIAAAGVDLDAPSESTTGGHGYPRDVGPTPLAIAARAGHLDALRKLLDLGAAVDAPSTIGQTALLAAVFSGQAPEVVQVLLDAGADPTITATCVSGCAFEEGDAVEWARRLGFTDLVPVLEEAVGR